ncbi:MAG: DUF2188 domain-containing protein [Candidatus Taylorbacteria bacterium]|nr:DUF2188 domain-containing protein [Candidatus Taylorbacteria bacterium]
MSKKNYHSVPWDGDWAVKKEGIAKPVSVHHTQAASEGKTRRLAKNAGVEAVYHNRQGIIKDKDSFGNDPYPPRDRKH